jgi:DNA polymerase-3 subunit alpha
MSASAAGVASRFIHLHVHSHFSLLDGANTIKGLVGAAKANQMPALALTDHGNLFGAVQFYRACEAEKLKPILGMEAYVAPGSRFDRKKAHGSAYYHFLLLARNEEGYRNLMKLSSLAYLEGFYYKPRIDKELLRQNSKGLIGMSACLSSEINRCALSGSDDELRSAVEEHRAIFEPGCFFLELQRNGIPEQDRILERVPPVARSLGIPLVASNDIHYLRREDSRAQEVHLCINTGTTLEDGDRMAFGSDQFYFRSGAEMERVLGDFPEAIANTGAVADLIDLELDFSKMHLPKFEADGVTDLRGYFRHLCEEGCRQRYPSYDRSPEIRKRLEYEMGVIEAMNYVSYFLIVWDFIRYAREQGIPVGPGRGSAAGSLVAFALGVTNVDPLHYDLLFERFLNSDRVSMPDIDIDFCMDRRGEVIDYVKRKYGADRVCQIITFGTMAARAVLRDVGRVLNIPLPEVDAIAKKIPSGPGVKLKDSLEQDAELRQLAEKDPRVKELFEISLKLEGLNRHASTHAAGVVISDAPLIETVPLQKNGEDLTTQYGMEDLEVCGMLKMDFLGLRTLTIIQECLRLIRATTGKDLDIDRLPLDDPKTYEMLQRGDAAAVFQLESQGMRDILRRLKPDRFEDIIAVLALYRPGPLGSGMVETYIKCKHGAELISYEHECLKPILSETNGVILYQEQVMRIAHDMCGFSLNEADNLRKAMGKKKPEIMAKYQAKFCDGAVSRGVDRGIAQRIWDLIVYFAGYGFNKSHSTAYALVSYQTAYLKANYPTEFLAAVMTCEMSNIDTMVENLGELRRLGIPVLPPDINRSQRGFSVHQDKVVYGLEAVKGIGGKTVEAIIDERQRRGEFRSIFEFCERVQSAALNKAALECLVSCGAFDSFGIARSRLHAVVDSALARGSAAQKDAQSGQLTLFELFDGGGASSAAKPIEDHYPEIAEWSDIDKLNKEKETLGFYLSGHPLTRWQPLIERFATHRIAEIQSAKSGERAVVGVQIAKLTKKVSKRSGEPFWIAQVEDLSGSLEIFVGQKLYDAHGALLLPQNIVFLRGAISQRDTNFSINVNDVIPVEEGPKRLTENLSLIIDIDRAPHVEDLIFRLKSLLDGHRGSIPVYLVLSNQQGERVTIQVGRENFVTPAAPLFDAMDELLGRHALVVNRSGG